MADRGNRLWPAIAWAEGMLLVGLGAVAFAAAASWQSCSFLWGCAPNESSLGAQDVVVWLVVLGVAMAIGIVMASWTSGWAGPRALVQAAVALMAGVVALVLGGRAFDGLVGEYLPALVLAVGVAGAVAIRPSSRRAVTARLVVLAIFVVLAIGVPSAGVVILRTVLTLPAMGAVESAVAPTAPE